MLRSGSDKRSETWNRFLIILFVVGVLAAVSIVIPRVIVENGNRTVEVIVDITSVTELADNTGDDVEQLLAVLKQLGVATIALPEVTVGDAIDAGLVSLLRPEELQTLPFTDPPLWLHSLIDNNSTNEVGSVYVTWQPATLPVWLDASLRTRMEQVGHRIPGPDDTVFWKVPQQDDPASRGLSNPAVGVRNMGLGFDPDEVADLAKHGFRIALRPVETPALTGGEIEQRIAVLKPFEAQRSIVIFDGASLPGDPVHRDTWLTVLEDASIDVAYIEFALQRGVPQLIESMDYAAIRLHSIAGPELHKLDRDQATARWIRAAKERGIRAFYVRLYTETPPDLMGHTSVDLTKANVEYIDGIISGLHKAGFSLGEARPLHLRDTGWPVLLLTFLAVGTATLWLVRRLYVSPVLIEAIGLLAFVAVLAFLGSELGRQGAALVAAIVFPTGATIFALDKRDVAPKYSVGKAVTSLFLAASISLLGALFLAAILAQTKFAMGLTLFRGVKVMHVVPPLVVALIMLWDSPLERLRDFPRRMVAIVRQPIAFGFVVFLGVVAAVTLLVVLRTGTDVLPVPGLEQRFREFLENVFGARPRNKEFLLGHPVFVVTAYLICREALKGVWKATFAAVASVGQLSLVNTFAHIHAPFLLSLQRTIYGLVLGAIIGGIGVYVVRMVSRLVRFDVSKKEAKPPCG